MHRELKSRRTSTSQKTFVDSFAHRQISRRCHAACAQKLLTAHLPILEAGLCLVAPFGAVVAAVVAIVYCPHLQLLPCFGTGTNVQSRRISRKFCSSANPSSRCLATFAWSKSFTTITSIMVVASLLSSAGGGAMVQTVGFSTLKVVRFVMKPRRLHPFAFVQKKR